MRLKDIDSIVQEDCMCYLCKEFPEEREWSSRLEKHHCFPGSRRKLSIKYGLWVWLCPKHHFQVHNTHPERLRMIQHDAQLAFELAHKIDREEFIKIFGKNFV